MYVFKVSADSYLSCFNHIKLYNFPITHTAEEFPRIVFLNGSLSRQQSTMKQILISQVYSDD